MVPWIGCCEWVELAILEELMVGLLWMCWNGITSWCRGQCVVSWNGSPKGLVSCVVWVSWNEWLQCVVSGNGITRWFRGLIVCEWAEAESPDGILIWVLLVRWNRITRWYTGLSVVGELKQNHQRALWVECCELRLPDYLVGRVAWVMSCKGITGWF